MLMPAAELPTFTLEQTRFVVLRASGIELTSSWSPRVKPFWMLAVKPSTKSTPSSVAARSRAAAIGTTV